MQPFVSTSRITSRIAPSPKPQCRRSCVVDSSICAFVMSLGSLGGWKSGMFTSGRFNVFFDHTDEVSNPG